MTTAPTPLHRVEVAVIGTSAGGVDALATLLADLPTPWHLPLVAVIHMPERRESRLTEVFAHRLSIPVREAEDKAPVTGGALYFAPPSYHLSIERSGEFSLSCEPPVMWSRPSIDLLMSSAADAYGPLAAGLLLTGANPDGARGMFHIHEAGGLTAVQDPGEAEVDTMPRAALALHHPDRVLPLRALRTFLMDLNALHAD